MKRKLALFMALTFVLGIFLPELKGVYFFGSDQLSLNVDFLNTLSNGTLNPIPVFSNNPESDNHVLFDWEFSETTPNGLYVLSYFIANGKKIEFAVENYYGIATATYIQYRHNKETDSFDPVTDITYRLYNNASTARPPYEDIDLYSRAPEEGDNAIITTDSNGDTLTHPMFRFVSNHGYSIQHDGIDVRFLSRNGRLFYMTSNMNGGNVYDVNLYYYESVHSYYENDVAKVDKTAFDQRTSRSVITGINTRTYSMIPTGNHRPDDTNLANTSKSFVNASLNNNLATSAGIMLDTAPLDMTLLHGDRDLNSPGQERLGMIFRFELPKKLNNTSFVFDMLPTSSDMVLTTTIALLHEKSEHNYRINVTDVYGTQSVANVLSPRNDITVSSFSVDDSGTLNIWVEGFEAGLMFTETELSFNAGSTSGREPSVRDRISLGFGRAYTFLRYDVRTSGENYFLRFDPYENVSGDYYLHSYLLPTPDVSDSVELRPEAKIWSNGKNEMIFPLLQTTTRDTIYFYYISFEPFSIHDMVAFSQRVKFQADPSDVSVSLPGNFSLLNSRLTPRDDAVSYGDIGNLDMTFSWNVSTFNILDKMIPDADTELEVRYSLHSTLQPNAENAQGEEDFAYVDVKIRRNPDFNPSIIENNDNLRFVCDISVDYNDLDTISHTVKIADPTFRLSGQNYYVVVPIDGLVAEREINRHANNPWTYFYYPNVYFMNLRIDEVNGKPYNSSTATSYASVTLDDITTLELPPPERVLVDSLVTTNTALGDDKNEVSGIFSFELPGRNIREYLEKSFTNLAERINNASSTDPTKNADTLEFDFTFNIYISTNQNKLIDNLAKSTDSSDDIRSLRSDASKIVAYEEKFGDELYFSKLDESDPTENIMKIDNREALHALREGDIVMIKGIPLSALDVEKIALHGEVIPINFSIKGLDKNQQYYICADLWMDSNIDRTKESPISSLFAFTTLSDEVEVGEEDKQPPSPEITGREAGMNWVSLKWKRIPETISGDDASIEEKIEYEILRVKNAQIEDTSALSITGDFADFYARVPENAEKKGFLTRVLDVLSYNASANPPWSNMTKGTDFDYALSSNEVTFTDMGLQPNQIYFYYVRTVRTTSGTRMINGVEVPFSVTRYSTWSQTSATTTNLQRPVNLTVDRSDRTAFDEKTEAILSFDVPITEWQESLGTEFDIQYIIKEGNGEWSEPITMSVEELKQQATLSPTIDKHTHFRYKVTGLKQNTGYSFMVRIINKDGDASMYSNIAETRTGLDQDDHEYEKEKEQWEDYARERLRDLFKRPYWHTSDTSANMTAVYRPSMFDSLLAESVTSQVMLVGSDKNASVITYYIPATAILSANAQRKSLTIGNGSMEITLSPNAFDPDTNPVLQAMILNVNNGNNSIEDYYIKINVVYSDEATVDGKPTVTPKTTISFEVVGANVVNLTWDRTILTLLTERIESDEVLNEVSEQLSVMIRNNSSPEEFIRYLNDYIEQLRIEFIGTVNGRLSTALESATAIVSINAPMIISYRPEDSTEAVSGYNFLNNTWIIRETVLLGDKRAMYVNAPGSYIFTGVVLVLNGLDTISGSYGLTSLINKYGLDDFLGKGTTFNIDGNATGLMVAGIVSRITGAARGSDPYEYLSSKGLTVSTRNQYSNISNQESIYLLMFIYAQKTNTDISTVTIRNYALTANITGLDDRYRKSVQVAFELDLYRNSAMKPRDPMTVRELLEFLKNLNNKVKL